MKNRLYYILLGLFISFFNVSNVFAFQFEMSGIASNTDVVAGEEVTVNVFLKSDSAIAGCLLKLESDDTVELVSKNGMNNWKISEEGVNGIFIEKTSLSDESMSSGKNILSLKYKVNGAGKAVIKTDHCVSTVTEEKGTHSDIIIGFTTKDISKDTSLKSLSISNATAIALSPNKYIYATELSSPNFSITMTTSNPDYQDDIVVTDSDNNVLDPSKIVFKDESGQGVMVIRITVNNDTKNVYEIGLGYQQEGLNNSLSSLKINGEDIKLEEGKVNYTITVGKDVTSLNVEANLSDSDNFKFADGNGPGHFNMGNDTISIALIIEPKSSQSGGKSITYMIDVLKEGGSSTHASSSQSKPLKPSSSLQNPQTGGISMFVMSFILIASLVGSVFLYQKNLESYK